MSPDRQSASTAAAISVRLEPPDSGTYRTELARMAQHTYKILLFMKRRPGMSVAAFQDYYEKHHAPLCEKYASGLQRYLRRFITPHPTPGITDASEELEFDVITELWFEKESIFRATVDYLTTSAMPDAVVEDEKRLFDRTKTRIATVVEYESQNLSVGRATP